MRGKWNSSSIAQLSFKMRCLLRLCQMYLMIFICEFFAGTFILFLKKTRKMKEIYNRLEESKEMRPCGLTLTAKWITWIESDSKEPRRIGMRCTNFPLLGVTCVFTRITNLLNRTTGSIFREFIIDINNNLQFERNLLAIFRI